MSSEIQLNNNKMPIICPFQTSPKSSVSNSSFTPKIQRDSLQQMQGGSKSPFNYLKKIWNAIVAFFASIFKSSPSTGPNKNTPPSTGPNNNTPGSKTFSNKDEARLNQIAKQKGFVWFYDSKQNSLTSFMGNFELCFINFQGLEFRCAEAAFQAMKFQNNKALMASFQNLDGDAALKKARSLTSTWTKDQHSQWQSRNLNVMRDVVYAKFSQNPGLKNRLLATADAYLVEHNPKKGRDTIWSDDNDGTGKNYLGLVMMETRQRLGGAGVKPRPASYIPKSCV